MTKKLSEQMKEHNKKVRQKRAEANKTVRAYHTSRSRKEPRYAYWPKSAPFGLNLDVAYSNKHDGSDGIWQEEWFFKQRIENSLYAERKFVYASRNKKEGWKLRPIDEAFSYSYIRVNPSSVCYYIIVDVDDTNKEDLLAQFKRTGIYPSFMVGSPERDDSWHLFFGLQYTEYQTDHRVERCRHLLTILFYGDTNYTNHFAKNPCSLAFQEHTIYFHMPNYDINDLKKRLDLAIKGLSKQERHVLHLAAHRMSAKGKHIQHLLENSSGSRNVDTFKALSFEARKFCNANSEKYQALSNKTRSERLQAHLTRCVKKSEFKDIVRDLPQNEIRSIIKSITRFNVENTFSNKFMSINERNSDTLELRQKALNFLLDNKDNMQILHEKINSVIYTEWATAIGCTENQIRYYVSMARAYLDISFRNSEYFDEGTHLLSNVPFAMKRAKWEHEYEQEHSFHEELNHEHQVSQLRTRIEKIKEKIIQDGGSEKDIDIATSEFRYKLNQLIAKFTENKALLNTFKNKLVSFYDPLAFKIKIASFSIEKQIKTLVEICAELESRVKMRTNSAKIREQEKSIMRQNFFLSHDGLGYDPNVEFA